MRVEIAREAIRLRKASWLETHVVQRVQALQRSLRAVWAQERFHYHERLYAPDSQFEGWYFKVVDAEERQAYAFIAGVILGGDRHAFVQVLDGRLGRSWYHRFPIEAFSAARDCFDVRIGKCRFSADELEIDLDRTDADGAHVLKGRLRFDASAAWPSSLFSPGAMGPYSFVPFIQCRHGFLSLDSTLSGWLEAHGVRRSFDRGRGYIEKDWGSNFPREYTWAQCNHYEEPGVAFAAAIGSSPWLNVTFRGFIIGFLHRGRVHCFRSYLGAVLEDLTVSDDLVTLRVRNRSHRLAMRATRTQGTTLLAPYDGKMRPRVAETMTSEIDLRFSTVAGQEIYRGTGRNAGLEVQTAKP